MKNKILIIFLFFVSFTFFATNAEAKTLANKKSNTYDEETNQLSAYQRLLTNRYNISIDNSIERSNKYKLIWRKHIPKTLLYLTGVEGLYSPNFRTRYYYGPNSNQLFGVPYHAVEKEKVYNKLDKNSYTFYKLEKNSNIPYNAWVLDYGTIFSDGMGYSVYKKMLASIEYAKYDKNLQKCAFIAATHFVQGDTSDDSFAEDYSDTIYEQTHKTNYNQKKSLSQMLMHIVKKIFSMLSNGKISYVEYFKLMFKHQIGNINACGNRIGVYAYPPYSSIYGRVVLFYLHK